MTSKRGEDVDVVPIDYAFHSNCERIFSMNRAASVL